MRLGQEIEDYDVDELPEEGSLALLPGTSNLRGRHAKRICSHEVGSGQVAKVEHTTSLFSREKGAIVCHQLSTVNLWANIS